MADIMCGAEPAVAAATVGAVSEVVVVACERPIARASRRRRMEYARRYVSGGGGIVVASDQQKRIRRQADEARGLLVGEGGGVVEEGVRDNKLAPGGGRGDGMEEEREGGFLVHPPPQISAPGSLPTKDWHAAPPPASAAAVPGYGMASVRGRRRDMEDAVSIRPDFLTTTPCGEEDNNCKGFHFYGVFDGHGCSHVAISCKDRMHELISQELRQQLLREKDDMPPDDSRSWDWDGVMGRCFARMDSEIVQAGRSPGLLSCGCDLQESSKCDHVGTTAVVAVVTGGHIVVANCGDSRAVMCRKGVPVPLSQDHKPDRPDELQRIQAAGGRVIYWDGARVLGVLAMSRAIGDNHLKPYVTSDPEVTVTARTGADEFLILASDGLWDVVTNTTACQVVRTCFKGNNRSRTTTTTTSTSGGGLSSSPVPPLGGTLLPSTGDGEDDGGGGRGDRQAGSDKACLEAAVLLTRLALARRSADNVSVVVVDLRRSDR